MRKRYLRLAALVCALAYLGIIGAAAVRLALRSAELERTASYEFKELVDKANAAASLGFLDEPFRDAVKQSLENSRSLAALIVTGPTGPEYAVERSGGYLEAEGEPRFAARFEIAPAPLVAPLRVENARNATVSAARFRAMPDEIVSVLRDALLMTLVPLSAALILLLFGSGSAPAPSEREAPPAADVAGAAPRPGNTPGFSDEFDIPEMETEPADEKPSGLYGPDGLLGWEEYLKDRLDAELRRAASFEQDLVLVCAESDAETPEAFAAFASMLVEFFSFKDLAFKRGDRGAAVILPNTDLEQGLRVAEAFMEKYRERFGADAADMALGLSARAGRLVEPERLTNEASGALRRARGNGRYQILAFKPDPERYRAFVAQS